MARNIEIGQVIHVVTELNYGGVESRVSLIASHRTLSQFHHSFVAIAAGGSVADAMVRTGASVLCLGVSPSVPSMQAFLQLVRLFRKRRPLIVHARGGEANFHATLAAKFAGVPIVFCEEIGLPAHSEIARLVYRFVYKLSSAVVAVSDSTADEIVRLGEASPGEVKILNGPARLGNYNARPAGGDKVWSLGYVGRLEPVKNPLSLIRAVAMLSDWGISVRLIMVGSGSLRKSVDAEVERLKLSGIVEVIGYAEKPFLYLDRIDLFVQPSLSEGLSMALVESMSRGIPCLASSFGGGKEIIEHGKTGWLLPNVDPLSVARGIVEVFGASQVERRQVTELARSSVSERFGIEGFMARLENLYISMISKG